MTVNTKLRINWILPGANMAGGTKSNRLIAEAMQRRGHDVRIFYSDVVRPWPPLSQPRQLFRRVRHEVAVRGKQRHQLSASEVPVIGVGHRPIEPDDVPDADVVVGTWWETMEWIKDWPATRGLKAYFVRGHELFGGDPDRVRATYRLPALKLVISTWLQRLMVSEYGDPNAVLVPNGADWSQFGSEPRGRQDRPTVGLVFSPATINGADTAFEAIYRVQQELPELRVVCFGSNPIDGRWTAPRNLEFHLRPPQSMIPELYRSADCWLLASMTEGFGMPGLEAAACRCPVVATRCGGPEDYVEEGVNGYLVPVADSEAMAAAILKVLTLDETRWKAMSESSYAIAKRFDWDHSAEILEDALMKVVRESERQKGDCEAVGSSECRR